MKKAINCMICSIEFASSHPQGCCSEHCRKECKRERWRRYKRKYPEKNRAVVAAWEKKNKGTARFKARKRKAWERWTSNNAVRYRESRKRYNQRKHLVYKAVKALGLLDGLNLAM